MAKRVLLFVLTNILIITTLSIVMSILGVGHYITEAGLDYGALFTFALIFGFGGSFISLAMSRIAAKWMMSVKVIDPASPGQFSWLVHTTHNLAKKANLSVMPEVGVYESPEVNAFATGPTKNRSLVAVSTGLLQRMSQDEIEGVLAHEVAHIQNGDMVTMTLIQGAVNTFAIFIARIVAFFVSQRVSDSARPMVHFFTVLILQILIAFFGAMLVAWFSRRREFRADAGAARLSSKNNMKSALQRLANNSGLVDEEHASLQNYKISGKRHGGLATLMASHPPLQDRIAALERAA
jgi:heat shock protein HtpX